MNIQTFQPTYKNSVNFGAMKKSQFSGIDFAAVEKYNAPIEKFNSHEDFDKWAQEKYYETLDADYGGRDSTVIKQRQQAQDDWEKELKKESFTPAEQLIILKGIVSGIKANNATPLPIYSRQVLYKSISDIEKNLETDKFYQFNFGTTYRNNLREFFIDSSNSDYTGWIKIPSREHDKENFNDNVNRLVALSSVHWCTKANHALSYLADGDFHIYMENGAPKIGVRVIDEQVEEIEDDLNRRVLTPSYFKILNEYIKENDFGIHDNTRSNYEASLKMSNGIKMAKDKIGDAIKNEDAEKIFNYIGIKTIKDDNGKLILSHYQQPEDFNFIDLGIKEDKLFEQVSEIRGDANFKNSSLKSLGNLEKIQGSANFTFSKINDLGKLKHIGGNADFEYSSVENLKNLERIDGNANFSYSSVQDLGKLKSIGGNANFYYSNVCRMNNLEEIGGNANFNSTIMKSLYNLKRIGGNVLFGYTHLDSLGELESVGGDVKFISTNFGNLNNLREIGGNLIIQNSKIASITPLKYVGGNMEITESEISSWRSLKNINGDVSIVHSTVPTENTPPYEEKKQSTFKKIMKFLKKI